MLSIAFCDDEPIMLEELFNVVKGYIDSKKLNLLQICLNLVKSLWKREYDAGNMILYFWILK